MDLKDLKEVIKVFDKSELNKLKIKQDDFEISMQRGFEGTVSTVVTSSGTEMRQQSAQTQTITSVPVATESSRADSAQISGETINAPMVGTFYGSPSPDSPAFVKVGDTVKKGQTLCILEAMKIMNEVEAEFDCKILKILIEDSFPVEYDMPLFLVEKL